MPSGWAGGEVNGGCVGRWAARKAGAGFLYSLCPEGEPPTPSHLAFTCVILRASDKLKDIISWEAPVSRQLL